MHLHQSGFVSNSVNEATLLVKNDLAWIWSKIINNEILHRLPRNLGSNFLLFAYTAIQHAVVQIGLNVQQHGVPPLSGYLKVSG